MADGQTPTDKELADAVRRMEERMQSIGINPGAVDGKVDDAFRAASKEIFGRIQALSGSGSDQTLQWNDQTAKQLETGIQTFLEGRQAKILDAVIQNDTQGFSMLKSGDIPVITAIKFSSARTNKTEDRVVHFFETAEGLDEGAQATIEKLGKNNLQYLPAMLEIAKDHKALVSDLRVMAAAGLLPGTEASPQIATPATTAPPAAAATTAPPAAAATTAPPAAAATTAPPAAAATTAPPAATQADDTKLTVDQALLAVHVGLNTISQSVEGLKGQYLGKDTNVAGQFADIFKTLNDGIALPKVNMEGAGITEIDDSEKKFIAYSVIALKTTLGMAPPNGLADGAYNEEIGDEIGNV